MVPVIRVEIKLYSKNYHLESTQPFPILDYIQMMDWFVDAVGHKVNPGYLEINYWDKNGHMQTTWSDVKETGIVTVVQAQEEIKKQWDELALIEVVYHHFKSAVASELLSEQRIRRSLMHYKETCVGLANMIIE
jgi:FAD/FMN-containing dehydrogenase